MSKSALQRERKKKSSSFEICQEVSVLSKDFLVPTYMILILSENIKATVLFFLKKLLVGSQLGVRRRAEEEVVNSTRGRGIEQDFRGVVKDT